MKVTAYMAIILVGIFGLSGVMVAQQQYHASFDLANFKNDKLEVTVKIPDLTEKKEVFIFPYVVPGTYDKSSFGRFIEDFEVFSKTGKKLKTRSLDENAYLVKKAHKATTVSYKVNDTWDTKSDHYVFQPGGLNFEKDKEFVINNFGICGYFNGYSDDYPYQLEVTKPSYMYGATSLDRLSTSATKDVFIAKNYVELVDQPILYARPDTVSYYEGDAKIVIAVHSPVDGVDAELIKDMIQPITAATSFVLGQIPTDEYWFLLHFFNWDDILFTNGGGSYGALEHNKSSLYFVPTYQGRDGVDVESIEGTIYDMATHEFLHILSPLNLHSEEIAYFDFYNTKMSEHLWLYEGVTEYLSIKSLLLGGLLTMDEFGAQLVEKIKNSELYKNMSFTEMSRNIIDPEMQREFANVYQKGALLALILDMKVAEVTDGKRDLIDLIQELIEDYGMAKPFKDEELFDVIASKTAPELRDFFARYFEGSDELPLEEMLESCGVSYISERTDEEYSFRPYFAEYNSNTGLMDVIPGEGNETIPKPISVAKLNGEEISFRAFRSLITNPSNSDPVKIDYVEGGKLKTMTVVPKLGPGKMEYVIEKMEVQTPRQSMLYNKLFTAGDRK